jgi:hypothetical protein
MNYRQKLQKGKKDKFLKQVVASFLETASNLTSSEILKGLSAGQLRKPSEVPRNLGLRNGDGFSVRCGKQDVGTLFYSNDRPGNDQSPELADRRYQNNGTFSFLFSTAYESRSPANYEQLARDVSSFDVGLFETDEELVEKKEIVAEPEVAEEPKLMSHVLELPSDKSKPDHAELMARLRKKGVIR